MALLFTLALSARLLAQWLLVRVVSRLKVGLQARWAQVVLCNPVLSRLAQVAPSLVVQAGILAVPHLPEAASTVIRNVAVALTVLHVVRVLIAMLDALNTAREPADEPRGSQRRSIKSYVQLGKLMLILLGGIVIVATLIDRSPLILLSGLGAMSAVLMLVFKDTILSFTAGVQLTANDMLRVGDWIEMPQVGADGDVIDIALNTVKVQNWDKTITTIPTWRLMSESYRNWRGMSQSGGRRMKRALRLDMTTVHFLSEAQIQRLGHIALLRPYLEGKQRDIQQTNATLRATLGEQASEPRQPAAVDQPGDFSRLCGGLLASASRHPPKHDVDGAHLGAYVRRGTRGVVLFHVHHGLGALRGNSGQHCRPPDRDPARV